MKPLVIAIDGPAGSGKSTVARRVAARLNLLYVDSGASYRTAALKVLRADFDIKNEQKIVSLVEKMDIKFSRIKNKGSVFMDGKDVSNEIRTPEVTDMATRISRLPGVRKRLVEMQRKSVPSKGAVMEGRDIGTKVFPDADLKIFLNASEETRTQRRLKEDLGNGRSVSLEGVRSEINRRDRLDSQRKISPLIPAIDAKNIDSTKLTVDQVVDEIIVLARERCAAKLRDG